MTVVPEPGSIESAASHPSLTKRRIHSEMFDRCVRREDDLPGLVAYAIYQQRKRDWIKNHLDRLRDYLTEAQIKNYSAAFCEPPQINSLRRDADAILTEFAEAIVENRALEMQEQAFNTRTTRELGALSAKIDKISGYKHHIIGHVIGFFVLVVMYVSITYAVNHEPSVRDFMRGSSEPARESTH